VLNRLQHKNVPIVLARLIIVENFEDNMNIHIKAFAHKHGCISVSVCLRVLTM